MIFKKFWSSFRAQLNKLANLFWEADPIAQMRYEYDLAVQQIKEGREGLEMYRGLVERVSRQVKDGEQALKKLQAQAKAYLQAGDRETAAKFALQLQKKKEEVAQNREQLDMHETAYENNLKKIKNANKKIIEVREKIKRYDAELKMAEAEAEIAKLSESFDMNVTTDFGEIETVVQQRIDKARGSVRVSADMSQKGVADIEAEERMEGALAEQALEDLEIELGMKTPETTPMVETDKELGPATVNER